MRPQAVTVHVGIDVLLRKQLSKTRRRISKSWPAGQSRELLEAWPARCEYTVVRMSENLKKMVDKSRRAQLAVCCVLCAVCCVLCAGAGCHGHGQPRPRLGCLVASQGFPGWNPARPAPYLALPFLVRPHCAVRGGQTHCPHAGGRRAAHVATDAGGASRGRRQDFAFGGYHAPFNVVCGRAHIHAYCTYYYR
jgi:hypothetical protein